MQKKRHKSPKKCQKELKSAKKLSTVDTFGNFLATYTIFVVVAVTQCENNFFICCSDSVQQT